MKVNLTPFELASLAANLADDKKALDIRLLETSDITSLSDYFVIASVESRTQMQALINSLTESIKTSCGYPVKGVERDESGQWAVIDYGDVVIHVFSRGSRDYYQLDAFWSHAMTIPQEKWVKALRQVS